MSRSRSPSDRRRSFRAEKRGYRGSSQICPHCKKDAKFEGYRTLNHLRTLLGEVCFERAYYHCQHCGRGECPGEKTLGIVDHQTPAHREVVTLAGMLHPFAEGAEQVLDRLAALRVATSTVQRTTEAVGAQVAKLQRGGAIFQDRATAWEWSRDARGQSVAYISVDATSVPQQGKHREKRDGRMPNVGAIFNPSPRKQKGRRDIHYVAGLMFLPQMSERLRQEARAVGLGRADVVIGLTDGGAGLEDCLLDVVSGLGNEQIVFIPDFHHARDHLVEFAKSLCENEACRIEPNLAGTVRGRYSERDQSSIR